MKRELSARRWRRRKLNISGCSEKHEIVTCIMSSMRG
jgi:hypothetical protein